MSSFGISPTGFKRKRLNQLLDELNAEVKSVFGENFNTSSESPDGQINGVISESNANLWELAEEAYNAFNPKAARGFALSNLVQLNGITRRPAVSSTAELTLTGTDGTVIPAGSLVSASSGVVFETDAEVTIGGGTATVDATATETGPIQAASGTISTIDTPITGWDTVINPEDAVLGADEETDPDLRARRELSVTSPAKGISETILADILSVDAVLEAFVYENDTDTVDGVTGTPPRQFQAVVLGGIDEDVARAIYDNKPIGIGSFGSTTVVVTDSQGFNHDISFTRPADIPIYIEINITKLKGFPLNGIDTIKQNIVDYTAGNLVSGRGFGVGDNIINSELYTPVNLVGGHTVDSLFIGTSVSPTTDDDIVIAFDEIPSFDIANIAVNVPG